MLLHFIVDNEHARLVHLDPQRDVSFGGGSEREPREYTFVVKLMASGRLVVEAEYRLLLSSQQPDIKLIRQSQPTLASSLIAETKQSFALLLDAEQSVFPRRLEHGACLHTFMLPPPESGDGECELAQFYCDGDLPVGSDYRGAPPSVYKCTLTNYSSAVVFNVKITFEVEHMKVRFTGEPAIEGQHRYKRRWTLVFPKIDPGDDRGIVFYTYSLFEDAMAFVNIPDTATLQVVGETARREVSLTKTSEWIATSVFRTKPVRAPVRS